jgi:signal transduction histidine kinase
VLGDPDKLAQVFTNLLTNAVKYAPHSEIVLRGYREEPFIHMQVQDRGVGIAPDRLEQIFEKHSGLETSTGLYIKGTGLGLPIVRQIVHMHGGKVWAESDYGQGSTFHVLLPMAGVETTAEIGER